MTPIAQALSAALLHFVWQGLLVAFLLRTALFLLKNRSAGARYLASGAALAALAILPVLTTWALYRSPAPVQGVAGFATAVWTAAALPGVGSRVAWLPVLETWALPLWFAGVFVFSVRLAWGCRQVSALRRAGEPAPGPVLAVAASLRAKLGSFRSVQIVITSQSDGPSVVGWLRPAILLPAATLLGLSEQQLEAVLAHEFAHIARHDYLVNLLQNLVETLLFYHPAVWWTSARMRHERELCCDDVAVRCCGDAICYARALTTLEKLRGGGLALAMGSTGGPLLYRIQRLMGLKPRETAPSRVPAVAALLLGVACLALNLNWAHAQEQSVPGVTGMVNSPDSPGVQVNLGGATVAERTGVEYPGSAWEHQIGGIVVVEATLDADGAVNDARILSGPTELRKNALQSVLEWRFTQAPAGTTHQVSINFQWEQAQKARDQAPRREVVLRYGANGLVWHSFVMSSDTESKKTPQSLEDERKAEKENQAEPAQLALAVTQSDRESGIVISQIDMAGLTETQQKQLSERLSVHLGDRLTSPEILDLAKAVSEFDPPMSLGLGRDVHNRLVIRLAPDRRR
jgi:TonB family protein